MTRKACLALLSLLVAVFACGRKEVFCDCAYGLVGLVLTTDEPVTEVTLSGTACGKGRFRCVPEAFDNQIHGECKEVQVEAAGAGTCVVDLRVGGVALRIERDIIKSPCTCSEPFFIEAHQAGEIDLRPKPDGGVTGAPAQDGATDVAPKSLPGFDPGLDLANCPDPSWLVDFITTTQPTAVFRTTYRGDVVFYAVTGCCDKFNLLYDRCGTLLCYPDGGLSGNGDGKCPDFFGSKAEEYVQIWDGLR